LIAVSEGWRGRLVEFELGIPVEGELRRVFGRIDFGVPQTFASIGIRSGLRMWCENMCRTAPVPLPL